MIEIPAILAADGYKMSHRRAYSPHTEVVYSTWTPRKSRMENINKVVVFGLQYFIKDYLIESFNKTFFERDKEEVLSEFKRVMKHYTGDEDVSHWEALHDLGYLPLKIDALEEGTLCPIRCPMFTIENTMPEFYWLTNFIETIMSTEVWKPMTSATIALQYRQILDKWANKTCDDNSHVDYQGHDFSMRGMAGLDAACSSGAGHLLSFKGSDTIPAILWLEKYYNADSTKELIASSIPATEHSVAETNIIEIEDNLDQPLSDEELSLLQGSLFDSGLGQRYVAELLYFNRLLNVYPSGIFSYVADTYNLWEVCSSILPQLKSKIMSRDGKVVIRPDSGDPVDIICGLNTNIEYKVEACRLFHRTGEEVISFNACSFVQDVFEEVTEYATQKAKGVVELLWDLFGGTINSKGYKVLDPHIGCIYGDAITLERAEEICRRLEAKGFASSNIVLGIGSYTYNMNTRDTFGFALKTTYGVVNGKELMLYKDPITDSGEKKSQKGMVLVYDDNGWICYDDELDFNGKHNNVLKDRDLLKPLFLNGELLRETSLEQVRAKLKGEELCCL